MMRNDSLRELHMLNSRLLLRGALCFYALRVCCHVFVSLFALQTPCAQTVLRTWNLTLHPFQG